MIFLSNLNLFMAAKGLLGYIMCINHFLLQKRPASQALCPMPLLAGSLIVPRTLRQGGYKNARTAFTGTVLGKCTVLFGFAKLGRWFLLAIPLSGNFLWHLGCAYLAVMSIVPIPYIRPFWLAWVFAITLNFKQGI
jgi:hypothetical protein